MSIFGFNPGFGRPVGRGTKAQAMSGWGRPRTGHAHAGLDIPLPVGTPILALADGRATRVQASNQGDAAGIWVGITHPSGIVSRYMHMSRADVKLNATVRKGQQIGLSGNTGIHNSGPHLHLDLKAPATLLPTIKAAAGEPANGWGPLISPYGYGIPGEPWVPVDSYAARTIADAKANGIPLYKGGGMGQALAILASLGAAYGVYRLLD